MTGDQRIHRDFRDVLFVPHYTVRRLTPLRRRRFPVFLVASALMAGLFMVVAPARSPAADVEQLAPGLRVVGRVPVVHEANGGGSGTGSLILNTRSRKGYLVLDGRGNAWTVVQGFDLDTLRLGRRVRLEGVLPIAGAFSGHDTGAVVHAVDEVGGRIFLALSDTIQTAQTGGGQASRPPFRQMLVLDEDKFWAGAPGWDRYLTVPPEDVVRLAGQSLHGATFYRDAHGDHLLLQWAAFSFIGRGLALAVIETQSSLYDNWLVSWNATSGAAEWSYLLRECASAPLREGSQFEHYPLEAVVTTSYIGIACQAKPRVAQVVKLGLTNGRPDATKIGVAPLPRSYVDAIADPVGQRMLLRAQDGGGTWWVYDLVAGAWVGSIGMANVDLRSNAGIDPATGRLYELLPDYVYHDTTNGVKLFPARGGLFASDTRLTPAPQASNLSHLLNYPGQFAIRVDPAAPGRARRVFVRRGSQFETTSSVYPRTVLGERRTPLEPHYLVIEDTVPVAQAPDTQAVDRMTTDVEERPGVTEVNAGGAAGGFGARVLLVGGLSGATSREPENWMRVFALHSACNPADRDVGAGVVSGAELRNSSALARARPLAVDATTREDLRKPDQRCKPNRISSPGASGGGNERVVGDEVAECSGQDGANVSTPPGDAPRRGAAAVACDQAAGVVRAEASHELSLAGGPTAVRVAEAWTKTEIKRIPGKGMFAEVTAVAKGVHIEGVGSIGLVRTVARTRAGGRRGTAGSDFTRTVCGIEMGTIGHSGCLADPDAAAALISTALGSRGRARAPKPDADLRGSPGGYLAAIQKPAAEEFSDTVINRDSSKAVPGFEITLFNDHHTQGAGRQIIQLGGVEATSTYGIYLLTKGGGSDSLPGGDDEGADVAGLEVGPGADGAGLMAAGIGAELSAAPAVAERSSGVTDLLSKLFGRPLVVRTLVEGLLAAAVWLVLGMPGYLATRRRLFAASFLSEESR